MSNRWLIGTAVVVALLVAVSIGAAVTRGQRDVANYPANTPEGTVQRYLQAVWAKNYQEAYSPLSDDLKAYCKPEHLADTSSWTREQDMRVSLVGSQTIDGKVRVEVRISQVHMGEPFTPSESSYTQRFLLVSQGAAGSEAWKFAEPPWPMSYCPGWEERFGPRKPYAPYNFPATPQMAATPHS